MTVPAIPKINLTVVLYLVVAVVLSVVVSILVDNYREGRAAVETVDKQSNIADTTTGVVEDGVTADEVQATVDAAVAEARTEWQQNQQRDKRNEPSTASRATRAVPVSVRNNLKQRRLTRERLGCVQGECVSPQRESDPAVEP